MRKFLLGLLLVVLVAALFYKSPFSAMYNYNKGKALYDGARYEQSLEYFEKSLFADSKGVLTRFYYVMALSKAKPTYSVQKKLYKMAVSTINDEATKVAKAQALALRFKLLEGIGDNYIYNASMGNDIMRWDIKSFPLKVYVEQSRDVSAHYYPAINTAFEMWMSRTNFVKFTFVDNPQEANILVRFKDIPKNLCTDGVCQYTVAYTEPEIVDGNVLKSMNLTFYKTNPVGENFTTLEIYNTALHEVGHTLGIMGHSDTPSDIMYATKEGEALTSVYAAYNSLSQRDLRTLVLLYRLKPTISDVKNLSGDNFYYAPLIIGGDEVRLQKKLDEYKRYVEQYPNIASGYINLSSVYADLGDFETAKKYLSVAKNLATNGDELFLVNYNMAVLYFNLQDYEQAMEFAILAKSIKANSSVVELISDIEKITH